MFALEGTELVVYTDLAYASAKTYQLRIQAQLPESPLDSVDWPVEITLDAEREIPLWRATLSSEWQEWYRGDSYSADRALDGSADTFASTDRPRAGEYWSASFDRGPYSVTRVRILNRSYAEIEEDDREAGCCGERLAAAKVEIDGQLCGSLPAETQDGRWYEVECSTALTGSSVKVTATTELPLNLA